MLSNLQRSLSQEIVAISRRMGSLGRGRQHQFRSRTRFGRRAQARGRSRRPRRRLRLRRSQLPAAAFRQARPIAMATQLKENFRTLVLALSPAVVASRLAFFQTRRKNFSPPLPSDLSGLQLDVRKALKKHAPVFK